MTYDGAAGKPAKVAITGGTVNGTLNTVDYSTGTTSNDPTKATIEVTGGTFSTNPSRYVVENLAATKNADGTVGVAKAYLAQVGETSYYTMDEASDAQTKTGEAITLLRDYTTGSAFKSGNDARVVDLNGHTWTCTGTDANSAAFEINYPDASLTVKNGKVVSSWLIGLIPSASAMGGTITYDNSNLTFEGVEATTTATSGIETNGNNTNDTVVLKNSTLNVPNGFGIYFPSSGTLTIDNSTINAKTMGAQVCSGNLNVTAGSAITVSGDPVEKAENDGAIQDGAAISIVNRAGYKGLGKIAITGGTFTAKPGNAALKAYTWDSSTKQESAFDNSAKTVAVSGGTFNKSISEGYCADGFIPTKNADGTYGVKEGHYVAQIGSKKYETLADAIRLAAKGKTITLLTDVEQNTQLTINKNITLDLNGKTIKNTQDIWGDKANAILSITNGAKVTITGDGTIDAKENDCYTINVVKGDLTIENGTFYGNVSVVQVEEGTLSVKGGTFDLHQKWEGSSKYLFNCIDDAYANGSANVAISGGTFVGFDPSASPEGEGTSYLAPGYAPTDNGGGTYGVKLAEGAYLLQDYRSGDQASWTYPTQEGMAFAGWYKDASFTTPCAASDVEGAAYAKFVPITDLLQFKGGSLRMDVTDPSTSTYLRFGYTMAIPEKSAFIENGWYYKKVTVSSPDDVRFVAYNNAMNNDGTVTANLVFNNVKTNLYKANFTEKAFVKYVTADGTTVEAVESDYQTRSVGEVADAILKHPMASNSEKEYALKIKSAIQ